MIMSTIQQQQTRNYRGFTLRLCWCGYPEMRWQIFWGNTWKGVSKTLYGAKMKVDGMLRNIPYLI